MGARKTGVMGKGKFHHRRGTGIEDAGGGFELHMDAEAPFRTHVLFGGRRDDDASMLDSVGGRRGGGGSGGQSSFVKQMFGWGKKADPKAAATVAATAAAPTPSDSQRSEQTNMYYQNFRVYLYINLELFL
jgi:hypothetical protein